MGGVDEPKSFKPPALPLFSGADPVPKDEASCEQWVWQVKAALKNCTAGAVRIAIVQFIRSEVREFAAAVGFEASVEMMLEKIEDHFGEKWTTDSLQQNFYKITQGKNEKVRQFIGRLEAHFKRLEEKVPGRYDSNILKKRFFHGMHQHLKDSIWFCYKQEDTTYEELFHEVVKADKEKVPENHQKQSQQLQEKTLLESRTSDTKKCPDYSGEVTHIWRSQAETIWKWYNSTEREGQWKNKWKPIQRMGSGNNICWAIQARTETLPVLSLLGRDIGISSVPVRGASIGGH